MFQSIRRGWIFLKQGWMFGQKTPVLLVPTLISFLVSFISLVVLLLPLAGLIVYIRKNVWGQFAIGFLIGLLLVLIVGIYKLFSFMTSNLARKKMAGESPATAQAWARLSDLGGGLFWVAMGLPVQAFWMGLLGLFSGRRFPTGWESAGHLFVPVAANEKVSLGKVPARIEHMQSDNCVFTADSVAVGTLNRLLWGLAALVGLAVGLGCAIWILKTSQDPSLARGLAFCAASVLLAIFVLPVTALASYTQVLFNTCLYTWGMNVREARENQAGAENAVPEPLAVALGLKTGR